MSRPDHATTRAVVFALSGLALSVGLFFVLMEPVTEVSARGPIGLARTDPSYPARLTLEGLGVQTSAQYGLGQLPPPGETIVLIGHGAEAQRALVDRLEPWVRSGGHLLMFAPEHELSTLLAALRPPSAEDEPEDEDLAEDEGEDAEEVGADAPVGDDEPEDHEELERQRNLRGGRLWEAFDLSIVRDPLLAADAPAKVELQLGEGEPAALSLAPGLSVSSPRARVSWTARPTVANADGGFGPDQEVAARVRYGAGHVTGAVDERFMLLSALQDEPGGVALLWSLLSVGGPPQSVRFVLQGGQGSIWTLVFRRAPLFVLAIGLFGGAVLLQLRSHFGPARQVEALPRRSLLEHIDGVGAFLWLRVGAAALLGPLRRRALKQLERSVPGISAFEPDARNLALAALTGLPEVELKIAFDVNLDDDRAELQSQLRTLQKLERLGRRGDLRELGAPPKPLEPPR